MHIFTQALNTSPKLLSSLILCATLAACGSSSTPAPTPTPEPTPAPTTASFEVTLQNLTAGQPLSPMVAVAHADGFQVFQLGEAASVGLERLAEGGESAPLLAAANDSKSVYAAAVASKGLPPGADSKITVTLTVPIASLASLKLSTAAMLGNSNDGFTGVSGQSLATLAVGASMQTNLLGYDAGTEANSESADTVPGPATANAGGKREPFNANRDDVINSVHVHAGIVSAEDGLPGSALTQAQRWDNPVAVLSVKRTQ